MSVDATTPREPNNAEKMVQVLEELLNMHRMDVKTLEDATYKRQRQIDKLEEEQQRDQENLQRVLGGASALQSAITKNKIFLKLHLDELKKDIEQPKPPKKQNRRK